jgi:hypothetical protein
MIAFCQVVCEIAGATVRDDPSPRATNWGHRWVGRADVGLDAEAAPPGIRMVGCHGVEGVGLLDIRQHVELNGTVHDLRGSGTGALPWIIPDLGGQHVGNVVHVMDRQVHLLEVVE